MPLYDLPDELLLHIADYLPKLRHINAFAQINRRNYHALNLYLYRLSLQICNLTLTQFAYSDKFPLWHIRALLERGASQADKDKALYAATLRGHYLVMKLLIKYGANVDAKTKKGYTPLHAAIFATEFTYLPIHGVIILLENGANPEERTDGYPKGYNALHLACLFGLLDIVEMILDSGMDIESKSTESPYRTPLLHAAEIVSFAPWALKCFLKTPIYNPPPFKYCYMTKIHVSVIFMLWRRGAKIDALPHTVRKELEGLVHTRALFHAGEDTPLPT